APPRPHDPHRLPLVVLARPQPEDQQRHADDRERRGQGGPPGEPAHPQCAREAGGLKVPGRRARAPKSGARPVRTPTVLQMEPVGGGAAALPIALPPSGRLVPQEARRRAWGAPRAGSKASNRGRAPRRYGLEAKGFKKEPADLRSLPTPTIL